MSEKTPKTKKRKNARQRERPKFMEKVKDYLGRKPFLAGFSLVVIYFVMDACLLNTGEELDTPTMTLCLGASLALFYLYYVHRRIFGPEKKDAHDIPSFCKHPKRVAGIGFLVLVLLSAVLFLAYDPIATDWFPSLGDNYYRSSLLLLVLIAPMIEELSFRYFFYDRWARRKFGIWKGVLLTSLIFVVCHPVSNVQSLILYWVPTLAFYLIYESFGLYGSIVAHMIFNFVAL